MISEKNENKRYYAKYIKIENNFVYSNKNKQYPLQKYQVRCIIKPTTGYDDITLRHYNIKRRK